VLDQLLDLPFRQRVLIYGGSALLIIGLYLFLFHIPRLRELSIKQEKIINLENERITLQALLKDQKMADAEVREIEALFNRVKAQLPEEKEIPELLRQVSNLGRDSGLEVTLFRQKQENLHDVYADVPVEMNVRGGYHQIALFFDKVRYLDRIVNLSDLSLKNPQAVDGQIQVESSFFATTYRFLSEEERVRIAKEKEEGEKKKKGKK
jgi:type IV pilus assembly protein PilO